MDNFKQVGRYLMLVMGSALSVDATTDAVLTEKEDIPAIFNAQRDAKKSDPSTGLEPTKPADKGIATPLKALVGALAILAAIGSRPSLPPGAPVAAPNEIRHQVVELPPRRESVTARAPIPGPSDDGPEHGIEELSEAFGTVRDELIQLLEKRVQKRGGWMVQGLKFTSDRKFLIAKIVVRVYGTDLSNRDDLQSLLDDLQKQCANLLEEKLNAVATERVLNSRDDLETIVGRVVDRQMGAA